MTNVQFQIEIITQLFQESLLVGGCSEDSNHSNCNPLTYSVLHYDVVNILIHFQDIVHQLKTVYPV
jgi:hypothetical protein